MTDYAVRVAIVTVILLGTVGCGSRQPTAPPQGSTQPDRFLFDRGTEALSDRQWENARTYFQQVVDNYPQSAIRPEAKLGVGDAYLGEESTESLVRAATEFREFIAFYPTHAQVDYAQYRLALTHYSQMRAADRDQSETIAALTEFELFFERYPDSPLMPQVKQDWRIARDRLSESSYRVGLLYYRTEWYPGAIDRFREVLRDDPTYTGRDAIYFYLAESLVRSDNTAEAIPYFQRLLDEFDQSEFLDDAQERLQELKVQELR